MIEATENFDDDKVYNLRVMAISWGLNPKVIEEKADCGDLTLQDTFLKVIVKVCREGMPIAANKIVIRITTDILFRDQGTTMFTRILFD